VPIGGGAIAASLPEAVRDILGLLFVVGVRLAAPIIIVLIVVEIAIGLIARSAPTLTFQVIGYPIRIILGLTLVAALIGTVPAVTNSLLDAVLMTGANTARAFR